MGSWSIMREFVPPMRFCVLFEESGSKRVKNWRGTSPSSPHEKGWGPNRRRNGRKDWYWTHVNLISFRALQWRKHKSYRFPRFQCWNYFVGLVHWTVWVRKLDGPFLWLTRNETKMCDKIRQLLHTPCRQREEDPPRDKGWARFASLGLINPLIKSYKLPFQPRSQHYRSSYYYHSSSTYYVVTLK